MTETTKEATKERRVQTEQAEYCEACGGEHTEAERVPVVGGEVIGQWNDPEPHVGVAGIETAADPDIELWCPHRYESEFDVDLTSGSTFRTAYNRTRRYVTKGTVSAFVLGVTIATFVLLFFAF